MTFFVALFVIAAYQSGDLLSHDLFDERIWRGAPLTNLVLLPIAIGTIYVMFGLQSIVMGLVFAVVGFVIDRLPVWSIPIAGLCGGVPSLAMFRQRPLVVPLGGHSLSEYKFAALMAFLTFLAAPAIWLLAKKVWSTKAAS